MQPIIADRPVMADQTPPTSLREFCKLAGETLKQSRERNAEFAAQHGDLLSIAHGLVAAREIERRLLVEAGIVVHDSPACSWCLNCGHPNDPHADLMDACGWCEERAIVRSAAERELILERATFTHQHSTGWCSIPAHEREARAAADRYHATYRDPWATR